MNKLILATALSTLPLSVFAQSPGQTSVGDKEFTLAGTGASDKNFDHGSVGLSVSYGQYFTDRWLIAIRQSINYADLPGDNNWNGSTRISADYHFGDGPLKFFLGGRLGGIYGDGVDETGIAGPAFGIKYYVKPETFLFAEAEYQFFFDSTDDVNSNFDDGSFVHSFGVGFNF